MADCPHGRGPEVRLRTPLSGAVRAVGGREAHRRGAATWSDMSYVAVRASDVRRTSTRVGPSAARSSRAGCWRSAWRGAARARRPAVGGAGRPGVAPRPARATSTVSDGTASAAADDLQRRPTPARGSLGLHRDRHAASRRRSSGALHLAGPARVVRGDHPASTADRQRRSRSGTLVNARARRAAAPARPTASSTAAWRRSTSQAGRHLRLPAQRLQQRHQQLPARHLHAEHQALHRRHDRLRQPAVDRAPTTLAAAPASTARSTSPARRAGTSSRSCPASRRPVDLTSLPGRLRRRALRRHRRGVRPAQRRHRPDASSRPRRRTARRARRRRSRRTRPRSPTSRRPPAAVSSSRRGSTRPRIYAPADLRAADLRAADLRAADLRAADLRAGRLRPRPRRPTRLPRRVLGRPEPDAARGLGQHRHRAPRRSRRRPATPTGYFYVRVQGHDDQSFDPRRPSTLARDHHRHRRHCAGLDDLPRDLADARARPRGDRPDDRRSSPTPTGSASRRARRRARRLPRPRWTASPAPPTARVVDVAAVAAGAGPAGRRSPGTRLPLRREPGRRAPSRSSSTASATTDSKYVVLAGGDDVDPVLPLPRHLRARPGEPVLPAGARRHARRAPASTHDQVQSQDAYGSDTDGHDRRRHPAGARPRRRPAGEDARRDRVDGRPLPRPRRTAALPDGPTSSLVTGYDFLADAADGVDERVHGRAPRRRRTTP